MYKFIFFFIFKRLPFRGILELEFEGRVYCFGSIGEKIKLKVLDKEFFKRIILYTDTGFETDYLDDVQLAVGKK